MRIRKDFVLRQVADTHVVIPLGQGVIDFDGMITLNGSGTMLWKVLENGTDQNALVDALTAEYDVSREEAASDVEEFLNTLRTAKCIEE